MKTIDHVAQDVLAVLATLTPRGAIIGYDKKLIGDLGLASDDATAMALELEKKYHIKIPIAEWSSVLTVRDAINLLYRHVAD